MTPEQWTDGQPCERDGLGWCAECKPPPRPPAWAWADQIQADYHPPPLTPEQVQRYVAERYAPPGWQYVGYTQGGVHLATEPDPAWLAFWEHLAALAERELESALGPWVCAEFSGRCRGCGERWEPGNPIRRSEEEGGWVAECCGTGDD